MSLVSLENELCGSDFISALNRDGEFADATDSFNFCKFDIRWVSLDTFKDLYTFLYMHESAFEFGAADTLSALGWQPNPDARLACLGSVATSPR
jgi:hypothetical protein